MRLRISASWWFTNLGSSSAERGWLLGRRRSRFRSFPRGKPVQQSHSLFEPGPFFAAQITRQRDFLVQDALRPLARFVGAPLRNQESRVIELRLGERRGGESLAKESLSFFRLVGLRIAVREQTGGALVIKLAIESHHPFEIGGGSRK